MAKSKWTKKRLTLQPHHLWRTKPGYKIFVADRGAVRLDFPDTWVVIPGPDSIKFHDKTPPDDDCTLQISVMRLPDYDWSGLPLSRLLGELVKHDSREVLARSEITDIRRGSLEISWAEIRFLDPNENREAFSRSCLARRSNIQPLLTFDFWADDAPKLVPVWDEVLSSLRVGETIGDPTLGDRGRG